jgi:energy-converting hydrogenase A subunit R
LKHVFVSDCEGPFTKNDNAYELTGQFVPKGEKVFASISKYDDVLADVVKRPGYNAGDTLKLVLPFLKASDLTDSQMQEFSAQTLILIAGTKQTLQHITSLTEAFIVSTSYEHHIKALCDHVDFPFENTYCTRISLDKYSISAEEKAKLKAIAKEIASQPIITIPPEAKTLKDLSNRDQETVNRLDEIFWKEIPAMKIGRIFSEVRPVGGEQKAAAIRDIVNKLKVPLSSVMYVGDSITDVQAFQLVREGGGFTVSFNGNGYAVRNAEVAVQAENNTVTAVLADVFLNHGKAKVIGLVETWTPEDLKDSVVNPALAKHLLSLHTNGLPKVQTVTPKNMEVLSKQSSEFRKKVRGEAVGKLG